MSLLKNNLDTGSSLWGDSRITSAASQILWPFTKGLRESGFEEPLAEPTGSAFKGLLMDSTGAAFKEPLKESKEWRESLSREDSVEAEPEPAANPSATLSSEDIEPSLIADRADCHVAL
ncbi:MULTISPECIES: hypothetical protein [unclassified Endozoicomonas]|uniref:hypothetical protein n=1 Tax=unclassified Endozoicomonas TaxID=2644528 RepID=UPI003BB80E8F